MKRSYNHTKYDKQIEKYIKKATRSRIKRELKAGMVERADTKDLKSLQLQVQILLPA